MRGVAEPRNLALAITRRARGPSYTRNFSAGIGRGRGEGSGKYEDADEPLFSTSFGHGAPRGVPLNAGFIGRGGPQNFASSSPGDPFSGFGKSSAGRGFNNLNQTHASETPFGRGSGSFNQGGDPFTNAKPPQTPSLNLNSGGFGRGKPVEKNDAPPEDIFSSDRRATLSSWSKWDQKLGKMDAKAGPSPAEMRLLQSEDSSSILPFPAIPQQQPGQRGPERQMQVLQPPVGATPLRAAPPQQQPPSSPGRQPVQQPNPFDQGSSSYTSPSPGWQQPAQQPYYDTRFQPRPSMQNAPPPPPTGWQQPLQQPYYDARSQPQPPMQYTPPSTGWQQQPVQQPYFDARVRPQPSTQSPTGWQQQFVQQPYYDAKSTTPPTGWQQPFQQPYFDARVQPQPLIQSAPPPTGWQQQPGQQPYYDARVQPQPFMQYMPPPTGFQPPASVSPLAAAPPQQPAPPGSPGWQQPIQEPYYDARIQQPYYDARIQQPQGAFAADDRRQAGGSMQVPPQPLDSFKPFAESSRGQYPYGDESVEPPSVAPTSSEADASGYEYDWGPPADSESINVPSEEPKVMAPTLGGTGIDYEGKVEESFKQNKLEEIDVIYSEMKDAQVRPSAKTYGTILQSYLQQGKMDKVSMIYQEMSGVLFTKEKPKDGKVKEASSDETPTADSVEIPSPHQIGAAASSPEAPSAAQVETKYDEDEVFIPSRSMDIPSASSDTGSKSFGSFGGPEPSIGIGMGRGKKVDMHGPEPSVGGLGRGKKVGSFFNFDFSGGLGSSDRDADIGKQSLQMGKERKAEVPDEYSQTFTPVIQPGWYAFAPDGLSVGPGAGRGRPQSPQARSLGLGSSPPQQFDSGLGQGSSYEQRMQAALQQAPPLYSRDSSSLVAGAAGLQYKDPEEEQVPSALTAEEAEEAAERAMRILRKMNRYKGMYEDDDSQVMRRSPLRLAQSLRERKVPKEPKQEVEKAVRLTEEEEKKEAERLKAMEENEALRELKHTFDSFMQCYGEMALEPEHELGDFTNPDIEEKPFMPLEEYLEKAKPNIMKTGLIRGEKEWQDMVKQTMRHLPYYEEFVERYSGPGRYTAKQENEDLEEIARTLPSDVGRAAKSFVQKSLTTLKSNPGFNLQQKQWMLASMVDEFSQYIVND